MNKRIFGGSLLIAGTMVGGGMLALPLSTGPMGLLYSILLLGVVWGISVYTAFLTVEAALWVPGDSVNLPSIVWNALGKWPCFVTIFMQLLFLYALDTAFISGIKGILSDVLGNFGFRDSSTLIVAGMLLAAMICFSRGINRIDGLNRYLMLALSLSYLVLISWTLPHIQGEFLLGHDARYIPGALAIVIEAFGFHVLLPSLIHYMKRDVKAVKRSIFWGSFLGLLIYLLWEFAIIGLIPREGAQGFVALASEKISFIAALSQHSMNPYWLACATFFAFFAMATSFIGVTLGLWDFIGDLMKKTQPGSNAKYIQLLATFIPAMGFSYFSPSIFMRALAYAGIFIALLEFALPALMVWRGRYRTDFHSAYRVTGGKRILLSILAFVFLVIIMQFFL